MDNSDNENTVVPRNCNKESPTAIQVNNYTRVSTKILMGDNNTLRDVSQRPVSVFTDTEECVPDGPRSPKCFIPKSYSPQCEDLQNRLKQHYKKATLPCVSWMNEDTDFLFDEHYVQVQLGTSKTSCRIDVDKIFYPTNSQPSRILIQGQPGFGKTTLATKIAHDWAHGANYLSNFKFAFLVLLGELNGNSVQQELIEIARELGCVDSKAVSETIDKQESETLLILDGLDEVVEREKNDLQKILFKDLYRTMTVIITSRSSCLNLKSRSFRGVLVSRHFHDKLINIIGIEVEDRIRFLKKFVKQDAEKVLERIQKLTQLNSELFKSPLLLILLSYFADKNEALLDVTTRTDVYQNLINFVIRRSLETRQGKVLGDSFSIFDCIGTEYNYKKTFQDFGRLCLGKIRGDACSLQFESDGITKGIYEMGFFACHKRTFFKTSENYEAFHLSFLEFAAAFALLCDFCDNDYHLHDSLKKLLIDIYMQHGTASLILPFFFGLVGEHAVSLFTDLQQYAHIFSSDEVLFWSALAECKLGDQLSALTNFIPPQICNQSNAILSKNELTMFQNVVRHGVQVDKLVRYCSRIPAYPVELPDGVVIPNLELAVHRKDRIDHCQIAQCDHLVLKFGGTYINNELCRKINYLFNSTVAKKKSLHIAEYYSCSDACDTKEDFTTTDLDLKKLIIRMTSSDDVCARFVRAMLSSSNSTIDSLSLTFPGTSNMCGTTKDTMYFSELLFTCSTHQYLTTLDLTAPFPIDLYTLTNGGQKKWQNLIFAVPEIKCSEPLQTKNCIDVLVSSSVNCLQSTGNYIFDLRLLVCNCSSCWYYTLTPWSGSDHIVELILFLDWSFTKLINCSSLCNFTSLEVFGVIVTDSIYNFSAVKIEDYSKCFLPSTVTKFIIQCSNTKSDNFYGTSKFLEILFSNLDVFLTLTSFDLIFPRGVTSNLFSSFASTTENDFFVVLEKLKIVLAADLLQNVNLICDEQLWRYVVEKNIFDFNALKVDHRLCGFSDEDPTYYKIMFNEFPNDFITNPHDDSPDQLRGSNNFSVTPINQYSITKL